MHCLTLELNGVTGWDLEFSALEKECVLLGGGNEIQRIVTGKGDFGVGS